MVNLLDKSLVSNILILCLLMQCEGKVELNGTILKCGSPTLMLDEAPELRHVVINCHRKIRLSITLYNTKVPPKNVEFLRIDIVYDPELRMMVRLLNPIVVMMKREPLILAYPFHYTTAVNAKTKEIVLNKQTRANYSGCDDMSPVHATCGIKTERGKIVPFSKGFCCSCKDNKESKTHPRGGQDCTKKTTEEEQDTYLTSAHCLHFDDTWYIVSSLDPPVIKHTVYLQVFVRHEKRDESFTWVDMTKNQSFAVGSDTPFQFNDEQSIVATYITEDPHESSVTVDYKRQFLLIPEMTPTIDFNSLPLAVKNGAPDFLILPKEFVRVDGTRCDKAGVSFDAFYKQKDRCNSPPNTCLKNQPFDLWEEDNKKRQDNNNGSYLLSFYGSVYEDPILFNKTSKEHWLAFEHESQHVSVVYVEMDASSIVALRTGKYARLTQLVTVSTTTDSKLLVYVTNIGLVPSRFSVKAVRCDDQVADSTDKSLLIPPQRSVMYELFISFKSLQLDGTFTCVVQASSVQLGIVAMREVTMKIGHRCVCLYHCQCNCFTDIMSSTCHAMDEESFHLAGFKGSLPILHRRGETQLFSLSTLFLLLVILLTLGFIKAFLGLYYNKTFEEFGLTPIIFQRKILKNYTETDLKSTPVEYDEEAYPVYPGTEERARVISRGKIFYLNLVFFLIFPLLLLLTCLRRSHKDSFDYAPLSVDEELHEKSNNKIQQPLVKEETTIWAERPRNSTNNIDTNTAVPLKSNLLRNNELEDTVYSTSHQVPQSVLPEHSIEEGNIARRKSMASSDSIVSHPPQLATTDDDTPEAKTSRHSKQEPRHSTQEPRHSTQEPRHSKQEPRHSKQEPRHFKQEPNEDDGNDIPLRKESVENNVPGMTDGLINETKKAIRPSVARSASTTEQDTLSSESNDDTKPKLIVYKKHRQSVSSYPDIAEEQKEALKKMSVSTGTYETSEEESSETEASTDTTESEAGKDEVHVKIAVDTEGKNSMA